jgi:diguanylate cyclase (GGDEF)-like protein
MQKDPRKQMFEDKAKEALFQQRLAELQARHATFPWATGETAKFDISPEESKLFADRAAEDSDLTDAELETRALLDLTSLPVNFKNFYKRLNYEILRAGRYKRDLSLILVAIDGLDAVVRKHGTRAQLAVIEHVGRTMLGSMRDVDVPGRCREDCFGIILPETPVAGAHIAAVRICTKLENLEIPGLGLEITVSVGGSSYPQNGNYVEDLFAHAAESLMSVMKSGGNSVSFSGDR